MSVEREYDPNTPQTALGDSLYSLDINENVQSKNTILQGGTLRTSNFAGRTATVKPGENINAAIGTLKSAGGGVLFLQAGTYYLTESIVGSSTISIVGEGINQTIIDFNSTSGQIIFDGNGTLLTHFNIQNLTVQTSLGDGIYIRSCQHFTLSNVRSISNGGKGINISAALNFTLQNCIGSSNTGSGIVIQSSAVSPNDTERFTLFNCSADSNGSSGFEFITSSPELIQTFSLLNCSASSNTADGFSVKLSGASVIRYFTIVGCIADGNSADGFDISTLRGSIFGNISINNGGYGYVIDSPLNSLIGNIDSNNTTGSWNIATTNEGNTLVGNLLSRADGTSAHSSFVVPGSNDINQYVANYGGNLRHEKRVFWMKNNTGSTLSSGQVVILDAVAAGDNVTTTTTAGDDKIFGVVSQTIASGSYGFVQTLGYTTVLKVDGTTDIAVGDFLCTFTTAGIAAKAGAGNQAFAIALKAYTTNDSNGVIDALLITPRKL